MTRLKLSAPRPARRVNDVRSDRLRRSRSCLNPSTTTRTLNRCHTRLFVTLSNFVNETININMKKKKIDGFFTLKVEAGGIGCAKHNCVISSANYRVG